MEVPCGLGRVCRGAMQVEKIMREYARDAVQVREGMWRCVRGPTQVVGCKCGSGRVCGDVQRVLCGLARAFRIAMWSGSMQEYARGVAQIRQGALGSMSSLHSASEEGLGKLHGWRRFT